MIISDPNMFTGDVKITRAPTFAAIAEEPSWESMGITGQYDRTGSWGARSGGAGSHGR